MTIVSPTGTGYYTTATPAYPTQSGSITDCGLYYQVGASDACSTIDLRFGITFSQLQKLNTYLDGSCSNLWLNYDIGVAEVVQPTISTDGSCGLGVTCTGSTFGSCCSSAGQCTNDCGSSGNSTVSTDGLCGPNNEFTTCVGSGFGDCCSTADYCSGTNCYRGACAS